jgi:myo-inositol-1(or 4)-monophosphatase
MFDVTDLRELRQLVKSAAAEELMTRFESVSADIKADGTLLTEADLAMQQRLQRELAERWPEFALLGEEMRAAEQAELLASHGHGLWCLDPLDGTSNFASGIPFFAVSLALIVAGVAHAAIVYDPARGECFSALRGHGAWLNEQPLRAPQTPSSLSQSMAMVDLKRLPASLVAAFAERSPYRSQRSFGSVALDWCWVACGRCQVYLHGGQKLWDFAAGELIMRESGACGGLLDDYEGDWLDSYSLTPRIAIAATHVSLLRQWRAWICEQLHV